MKNPKYKLLKCYTTNIAQVDKDELVYRLQALRDIPEHGVKAGDLGGYVSGKKNLSHEGSCWIGGEALVLGKQAFVSEDAYVGDDAIVYWQYNYFENYTPGLISIKGNAKVTGKAFIHAVRPQAASFCQPRTIITGQAHIFENARLENVYIVMDNAKIYGDCHVLGTQTVKDDAQIYGLARVIGTELVSGTTEIFGDAEIGKGCKILGDSKVLESAKLEQGVHVKDSVIAGTTHLLANQRVWDGKLNENLIGSTLDGLGNSTSAKDMYQQSVVSGPVPVVNTSLRAFMEIKESIASYESDVVKIIKYPVMTDRTNSFTQEMILALNNTNRLSDTPETNDFKEAVRELEKAFLAAESNAVKLSATLLNESERKKTEKAKALFRVAVNEASSEQEKRVAFIQGFKQLEGVLTVPEVAMDTFRIKIGLKEIEA